MESLMKKIIYIGIVAIILSFAAYQMHKNKLAKQQIVRDIKSRTDQYGFVDISVNLTGRDGIVILAPINCPSDQAKRADKLARELENMKIPVIRMNGYHYQMDLSNYTEREANQIVNRIYYVQKMPAPVVFVNGKVKSNASITDIINENKIQRGF